MTSDTEPAEATPRLQAGRGDHLRELSTAELDKVAGSFVEILIYTAASNYAAGTAYYRYLKWADKI